MDDVWFCTCAPRPARGFLPFTTPRLFNHMQTTGGIKSYCSSCFEAWIKDWLHALNRGFGILQLGSYIGSICIYLYTFKSYIYIWFSISCVGKGILPLLRLNPFPGSASASTVLPFGLQHSSHLGPWWRRYPRLGAWSLRDPVQENPAPRENITNRNQWKRKCHPT